MAVCHNGTKVSNESADAPSQAHLQGTQSRHTKANLAKELQLLTHGKQFYNLTADHYLLHLQR